jgi:hypothetical protein
MTSTTPALHFTSLIIFLILSLKLLGLQERVPKASAGSLVPELDGPIYNGIFSDICPSFSVPNFLIIIDPAQIAWTSQSVTYSLPSPFSCVHFDDSTYA